MRFNFKEIIQFIKSIGSCKFLPLALADAEEGNSEL